MHEKKDGHLSGNRMTITSSTDGANGYTKRNQLMSLTGQLVHYSHLLPSHYQGSIDVS